MALQKQIHVYSIDTSAFYKKRERALHKKLNILYMCKKNIQKKMKKSKDEQLEFFKKRFKLINKKIKSLKKKLSKMLSLNTCVRNLNGDFLNKKNVVSIFESSLTRTMQIPINTLSTDIFIVKAYFFDVIRDLILDGFVYNNENYVYFTSSAGQIRTKKTVFIKEKVLKEIENTLMCGLTVEDINNCGGVNINKYLAYLALCNSATDEWVDFNISKSIVVDDMELNVKGTVDYIDDETYNIIRKENELVPITITDGCGMILPRVSKKSFMVRLPWIKGLLIPFPFDDFIQNISHDGKIKDIYEKEWDIIKDGIEIIFTKSQFKMWKFYRSWQEYCNNFKNHYCQAAKCNEEEDIFENAKINYQMLQSLTDITEDELNYLAGKTIKYINKLGKDKRTMLKTFGVTKGNIHKTYLQQAIELYPELLNDVYTKEILRDIKRSLVTEGRAGKFEINGVFSFICPDLYAFCEFLFMNDKNPKGLIDNNQVYCKLFNNVDKLDCLRSPHLFREHAIRNNIVDESKNNWFITNGLYTSCHDLISKVLQFDNDGDKSLVVSDTTFVSIAERNMKNIVPLYYHMKKSEAELISNKTKFNGLKLAYSGGNIGIISNNITKIWNSKDIHNNEEAIKVIKLLCMENNFTIDYAKTLYKPIRPPEIKKLISKYTKGKPPYFFIYAKDKKYNQVEKCNKSSVNKLSNVVPNPRVTFDIKGDFNYKNLMYDTDAEINENIIDAYKKLDKKQHFLISIEEDQDNNNIDYIYLDIREQLLKVSQNIYYVTDVLVKYLYEIKHSKFKDTLWMSFGDIIIDNIKCNLNINYIYCENCGDLVIQRNNRHKYCAECWKEKQREWQRESMKKSRIRKM